MIWLPWYGLENVIILYQGRRYFKDNACVIMVTGDITYAKNKLNL